MENNEGRGIIIYILNSLHAENINLVSTFKECLFREIKLNIKTFLGCIYRSKGGSEENDAELLNMIRSTSGLKYSYIAITGDFNLPDINWKHWMIKSINPTNLNLKFVECFRDTFMFQHVSNPTMGRGTTNTNLLDLILSNEEDNIEELEYFSPLGKSDHYVITFNILCKVITNTLKKGSYLIRQIMKK